MKKFNIRVNGNSYEVEVEEVLTTSSTSVSEPRVETARPAKPATKKVQKPKVAPVGAGQEVISSPMPGSIWKLSVVEGQEVVAGDVLLILEAMKMENEILAPRDGVVAKVSTSEGATVNTGDQLIIIE